MKTNQVITNPRQLESSVNAIDDNNHSFQHPSGNILMYQKNSLEPNQYYISAQTTNALIFGVHNSKVYQRLIKPQIDNNSKASKQYQKSMIINDVTGQIYNDMAKKLSQRGYNVKVLNLCQNETFKNSIKYNPLTTVINNIYTDNLTRAEYQCNEIAQVIYNAKGQGKNAFFYEEAKLFFTEAIISTIEKYKAQGKSKQQTTKLVTLSKVNAKLVKNIPNSKITDNKETGSVLYTFTNGLRVFKLHYLNRIFSDNTINFNQVLYNPTNPVAIFIETSQHIETNYLGSMLIRQVNDLIIHNKLNSNQKLPHPLQFILAPVANFGQIDKLGITLSQSLYNQVSFIFQFQNKEQLKHVYGNNEATIITSNCDIVYDALTNANYNVPGVSSSVSRVKITTRSLNKPDSKPVTIYKSKPLKGNKIIIFRANHKTIITTLPVK